MKISDLNKIDTLSFVSNDYTDCEILDGYTSDLLSDVMGNSNEDSLLITIQAHKNTIAVAQLMGIKAIIICNGREIEKDMLEAAAKEKIAILATTDNQFTTSYKVAKLMGK